jgi:hypothetical protein
MGYIYGEEEIWHAYFVVWWIAVPSNLPHPIYLA